MNVRLTAKNDTEDGPSVVKTKQEEGKLGRDPIGYRVVELDNYMKQEVAQIRVREDRAHPMID